MAAGDPSLPRTSVSRPDDTREDDGDGACLSEDCIVAYVERRLGERELLTADAHLDVCDACATLLAAYARSELADGATTGGPAPAGAPVVLPAGTRLGRYTIIERVGAGGMGTVYAGYDPELDRKVALKVVTHAGADPARLLREARALARLSHPNIVVVHDVGEVQGAVYVAMEFLRGRTLRAWFAAGGHALGEVLAVMVAAGRGLAAAHRAGLVHRDFKPENVMLGDDGRVHVLDFGLVGHAAADAGSGPTADAPGEPMTLTRTGMMMGTPAYMSPEQYLHKTIDARSDQYNYCTALFEAVHGRRPISAHTVAEQRRRVLAGELDEPPAAGRVPVRLARAIQRGLTVHPAQRWPDMDALLAEVTNERGATRRRGLAIALGGGLMLAGGLVGTQWRASEAGLCTAGAGLIADEWSDERRAQVAASLAGTGLPYAAAASERVDEILGEYARGWAAGHDEACAATAVRHEQSSELLDLRMICLEERRQAFSAVVEQFAAADAATVERAVATATALPPLAPCSDRSLLLSRARSPDDPAAAAAVAAAGQQLARTTAMIQTGHYDDAEAALQRGLPAAERLGHAPLRAQWGTLAGSLHERRGNYRESEAALIGAYSAAREVDDREDAAAAATMLVQVVGARLGRVDEAALWRRLAAGDLGTHADASRRARLANNWGAAQIADGKFAEALAPLTEATTLLAGALGEQHLELASPLNNLGVVHLRLGDLAAADHHYTRALAIREANLGADHPDVARVLSNIASVRIGQGRVVEAEASERRALTIRERALGAGSSEVAASLGNLALIVLERGDFATSEALLMRALAIYRVNYGDDHAKVVELELNLVANLVAAGRIPQAITRAREVIAHATVTGGASVMQIAHVQATLAHCLWQTGSFAEAEAEAKRSLATLGEQLGQDHPDLAYPLLVLARVDLARGHGDAARAAAERALQLRAGKASPSELAHTQAVAARAFAAVDPARARVLADAARRNIAGHRDEAELTATLPE